MNQNQEMMNTLESSGEKVVRGNPFAYPSATLGARFLRVALGFFLFPAFVFAEEEEEGVGGLFDILDTLIGLVSSIIPVLIGVAVVVFFWGLVKFIAHADDEKAVTEGKQFMIWGMVGIFIIVAFWSIVGFIQAELGLDTLTVGLEAPTLPTELPD